MWDYTPKVMEHFLNPRNVGEVENPDGVAEVGNMACGDALRLSFKLDDHKRIQEVKFKTFGCGSAIASSSALTEMILGKTLEEALSISNKEIADYLGGLPEEKMHCSVMGMEALSAAVAHYRGKNGAEKKEIDGKIVCKCFGVTDKLIKKVVAENKLKTIEEVTNYCKAGGGCQSCHDEIQKIIEEVYTAKAKETKPLDPVPRKKLSNIQRMQLIMQVVEDQVKPSLQKDGGDIEIIDIEGNNVYVKLTGTCRGCAMAQFTLRDFVKAKLQEYVSEELNVIGVE